jgi:anti-repressor protein
VAKKDNFKVGDKIVYIEIDSQLPEREEFEFLRDRGVLMSNNQPKQTYCDRGYFRVVESKYNKPDGSSHINLKTVVYQKGLDYIRKLLETEK